MAFISQELLGRVHRDFFHLNVLRVLRDFFITMEEIPEDIIMEEIVEVEDVSMEDLNEDVIKEKKKKLLDNKGQETR